MYFGECEYIYVQYIYIARKREWSVRQVAFHFCFILTLKLRFLFALYVYLAGFTKRCLLTCDNAADGDWQPVGVSVATVTTVAPC